MQPNKFTKIIKWTLIIIIIPCLSWGNEIILSCTPKVYKMFDGVSFNKSNLTDEDLETISFKMKIDKLLNYIGLETSSGFKKKFEINYIDKFIVKASGIWSDQDYSIIIDNYSDYKVDIKFEELTSFDYGSCKSS